MNPIPSQVDQVPTPDQNGASSQGIDQGIETETVASPWPLTQSTLEP